MNLHLKNKFCFLLILLGGYFCPTFAQQKFKYKAAVQKVNTNQFYSITLQPDFTAKCQLGLPDIKITDEKGTVVPYLLGNTLPVHAQSSYRELPKVLTSTLKDSLTSYIAENKEGLNINQLWITLQNTAVNRTVNLLGSDDLQHWFAIKERIDLQQTTPGKTGTFVELLNFPLSTYRYFKIQVNNKNSTPIHILQAGVYLKQQVTPDYTPVPIANFSITHKADTSLININFNDSYQINKIHLQLAGTKYYQRRISLYGIEGKNKQWLTDSLINSSGNGDIYLSAKANRLQLIIQNEDNPPLLVKAIQAYQLNQTLIAYLENQHHYQLFFGNDKAIAPRYDLNIFKDSINHTLPVISHMAITPILYTAQKHSHSTIPTWLLWAAGGLALIMLLALTLKMTKEISRETKKN
ncbi:DUF3999 family protein [Mucilaginibacter lacusdianchii]|uniref:DUF3999 family protein n=1 Tax=Mucilaginibacter lacusdianchii TaxID=2684211 RepID=UPI00131D0A94|nr:DUF3999 family protein [Mucilaginibacter sp. JXJ CY 39]